MDYYFLLRLMNSLYGFQMRLISLFKKIKIILIQFIFIFLIFNQQSLTEADEINDLEIEGMSIGDSALDYFSEKKINSNIGEKQYKSDKFYYVNIEDSKKFENYEYIQFHFKKMITNTLFIHLGNSKMEIKSCLNKQKKFTKKYQNYLMI